MICPKSAFITSLSILDFFSPSFSAFLKRGYSTQIWYYTLAALIIPVVSQTSEAHIIYPEQVSPQQNQLSNTITYSDQKSDPLASPKEARPLSTALSAALVESLLETSTTTQSLVQGGRQPSLQTEPSGTNNQPFQPQNVPLQQLRSTERRARSAPGISILTPSAYGQSWGSASIGAGFQSRTRFTNKADGVLGFGIGLGNAQKAVGLDLGLTLVDLKPIENIVQSGTLSLKLHRRLPDDFAIAVGVKNLVRFGGTDSGTGYYGVVTKRFTLQENVEKPFSQLFVSAGLGSGQFRSELDINNKQDTVGLFGSVAVRMAEPVSAIAEWSGQDLSLGLSIVPFRDVPLVITPAITDITGNAGDGSRFILGIGYGISF